MQGAHLKGCMYGHDCDPHGAPTSRSCDGFVRIWRYMAGGIASGGGRPGLLAPIGWT